MPSDDEQDLLKTPPASTNNELPPDFDAGINTSAAWTESRDKGRSLSDEETDPNDPELDYLQTSGRPARALYSFEGKPEFREVCVSAGDEVEIMREEVGDGWSLVKLFVEGGVELGLLPRSYYAVRLNGYVVPSTDKVPVHRRLHIRPIS
jgi:sorting nexin-9/18/33